MFDDLYKAVRPEITPYPWMAECEMILVTNEQELKQCIDECIEAGVYGLDLETTGLDSRVFNGETRDKIVGFCLAPTNNKGYYVPVRHIDGVNIPWTTAHREMCRLGNSESKAVFHNAKFDAEFLQYNGTSPIGNWDNVDSWHDTMVLAYLRNQKAMRIGLKHLSKTELDCEQIELKELFGPEHKGNLNFSFLESEWEPCIWYAASDAICTLRLFNLLYPQFMREIKGVRSMKSIYKIERMALNATRWMERCRIPTDQEKVKELIRLGQKEWWQSVNGVYESAQEALGRDVRPAWVRLFDGSIKSGLKFDPDAVTPSYKERMDEARSHAKRMHLDSTDKVPKVVPHLTIEGKDETVQFPITYDINAPAQLGLMLRELNVPGLQATEKSGQVKTSKDELDRVVEEAGDRFTYMSQIKRFREVSKALSTYLISMLEHAAPDGTLKPNFNGLKTDTGRFAAPTSRNPHLDGGCTVPWQGMPSGYDPNRPECLKRLRECIVGRDNRVLVAIDYAGVELRIASNLSREPKWMAEYFRCADCGEGFEKGDGQSTPDAPPPFCPNCGSDKIGDLHSLTTIMLYGEEVKKDKKMFKAKRQIGKQTNFLLAYGGGPNALSGLGLDRSEAERVKETFDKSYPVLRNWWAAQKRYGRKYNFVSTAFGRRCPVPDINMPKFDKQTGRRNGAFISKAERNATNAPVQGTSADITKMAMGMIHQHAIKHGWLDRMGMMITMHDELVFDVEPSLMKEFLDVVPHLMASNKVIKAMKWPVPLTVDIEMGKDWTVPYNITEIIDSGEAPEGLRNLLGHYLDDILATKAKAPSATETEQSTEPISTEFTYQLPDHLTPRLAVKLATAINNSYSPEGQILMLSGKGAKTVGAVAFEGKPPRIDPDTFIRFMGE
tara:strand:+ start:13885 stop:16566 length:2682 start_codon:yes stop_codon:yes gene_type:complete